MIEAILEARVKDLGRIYYGKGHFNDLDLGGKGDYENVENLSFRDLAYTRIIERKNSLVTQNASYVGEGFLYLPNEGIVLISKDSNPLKDGHRLIDIAKPEQIKEIIDIIEQDKHKKLEKRRAIKFRDLGDQIEQVFIPTDRLNDSDIAKWIFKDTTIKYGRFLRDLGIDELEIRYEEHGSPFFSFIHCGGCSIPGCNIYEEENSEIHLGFYPVSGSDEEFKSGPSRILYRSKFPN